jgi:hypothetical protein
MPSGAMCQLRKLLRLLPCALFKATVLGGVKLIILIPSRRASAAITAVHRPQRPKDTHPPLQRN